MGYGFLGVVLFSLTLPATRAAVAAFHPAVVGLGRALIAAVLAAAALSLTRQPRPDRAQWRGLLVVAAGVVLGFPLLTAWALERVPATHGRRLAATRVLRPSPPPGCHTAGCPGGSSGPNPPRARTGSRDATASAAPRPGKRPSGPPDHPFPRPGGGNRHCCGSGACPFQYARPAVLPCGEVSTAETPSLWVERDAYLHTPTSPLPLRICGRRPWQRSARGDKRR